MAFVLKKAAGSGNTGSNNNENSERHVVDWDGLNAHLVGASGTATKARTIPGIISGIVDVGIQNRENYTGPSDVPSDKEEEYLASNPGARFYDEGGKRMVERPLKPTQMVVFLVDFPQITVDKGLYYNGESDPLPLRLLMGGEFSVKGDEGWERIAARMYALNETVVVESPRKWAFAGNSTLHKMAEGAELLDEGGHFKSERVPELLGKPLLFKMQVFIKRKDGKNYLEEKCAFVGGIPEGLSAPVMPENVPLILTGVYDQNPPEEQVRLLRKSIKNTMKRSVDWNTKDAEPMRLLIEGSQEATGGTPAKTPTEGTGKGTGSSPADSEVPSRQPSASKPEKPKKDWEVEDDEVPFS